MNPNNIGPVMQTPEILDDRRNGYAYWRFTPENPVSVEAGSPRLREYGDYQEIPEIVDSALEHGSVLVQGEPGSGKSHLVRDIKAGCIIADIPCLELTLHINAGKQEGIENARAALEEFQDYFDGTGAQNGIIILDNVDYVGYKGSSRRRGKAADYAQGALGFIKQVMDDSRFTVIGTAHDDDWRKGQWRWNDEQIDGPAHQILELFASRAVFEGAMSLMGLTRIVQESSRKRGLEISMGVAASVIRNLYNADRARFFFANHIDPSKFLLSPASEIGRLEQGRLERKGQHKISDNS